MYIAPSGVQKERVQSDDMFIYGEDEQLIEAPCKKHLRPSACTPLFFNAYRVGAGAVIHTYTRPSPTAHRPLSVLTAHAHTRDRTHTPPHTHATAHTQNRTRTGTRCTRCW